MKRLFVNYLKKEKKEISHLSFENGLSSSYLPLVQNFFQCNINIYTKTNIPITKLDKSEITSSLKKKSHIVPVSWSSFYKKTINLFELPTKVKNLHHVAAITNPVLFMDKHFCNNCGRQFSQKPSLFRHILTTTDCTKPKNLLLGNKQVSMPQNVLATQAGFTNNCQLFNSVIFFYLFNGTMGYHVHISCCHNNNVIYELNQSFSTMELLTQFALTFLKQCKDEREQKLKNNISFLGELQGRIEKASEIGLTLNNSGTQNVEIQELYSLQNLKRFFIDYIAHKNSFVITSKSEKNLGFQFLEKIAKFSLLKFPEDSIKSKSVKFCLSEISISGPNSGFRFILSSNFGYYASSCNPNPTTVINKFLKLNCFSKTNLKVDLFSGEVKSITGLAQIYFFSSPNVHPFSFISPNQQLAQKIEENVKFGYIMASPGSCTFPQGELKSFFTVDFKKFYATTLKHSKMLLSQPMIFEKQQNSLIRTSKTLPHHSFANLFFCALQEICCGKFRFGLTSKEFRCFNLPQDCLIQLNDQKALCLTFFGCFHHACSREHHLSHDYFQCNCPYCVSNRTLCNSTLKPKLWKLPPNHSFDESRHPLKTKFTYKEINEKSLAIVNLVSKSPFISKMEIISECDVIYFWDKPLWEFAHKFSLPLKPNVDKNATFKSIMIKTTTLYFPLLQKHGKGMTDISLSRVITAIKKNSISGLISVSGFCPDNHPSLGNLKVFSHKKSGKMVNSNTIENGLLTIEFLSFLLNEKQLSFNLKDIHTLYLYPNAKQATFYDPSNQILNLADTNEDDTIKPFLKSISNFFIGSLAYNPNRYQKTVIINKNQLITTNLKGFKGSKPLTNDHCFGFFSHNKPYVNASHNNFFLVFQARLKWLQFHVKLKRFLNIQILSQNTDGATYGCPNPFPGATYGCPSPFPITPIVTPVTLNSSTAVTPPIVTPVTSPTVFLLNHYLKSSLNVNDLLQYISFQREFFDLPICKKHESEYLEHLTHRQIFQPQENCCFMTDNNRIHTVKIEHAGSHCFVAGQNLSVFFDQLSNSACYKSSGISKPDVKRFMGFCQNDTQKRVCEEISLLISLHDGSLHDGAAST